MFNLFSIKLFWICYYKKMKPPVGIPGVDVFYINSICDKCNRHFLIQDEVKEHQRTCRV